MQPVMAKLCCEYRRHLLKNIHINMFSCSLPNKVWAPYFRGNVQSGTRNGGRYNSKRMIIGVCPAMSRRSSYTVIYKIKNRRHCWLLEGYWYGRPMTVVWNLRRRLLEEIFGEDCKVWISIILKILFVKLWDKKLIMKENSPPHLIR